MNTDRKLLEAAAKAAGLNVKADRVDADDLFIGLIVGPKHTKLKVDWNPLTDDGDALRLAVKLDLLLMPYPLDRAVRVTRLDQPDTIVSWGTPPDPCAATRRAIVRAAAVMVAG